MKTNEYNFFFRLIKARGDWNNYKILSHTFTSIKYLARYYMYTMNEDFKSILS